MATIVGTEGPDSLTGSLADDTITGLGGDDTLVESGGFDSLSGGEGNDLLVFVGSTSAGEVQIIHDTIDGGAGSDTLEAYNFFGRITPFTLGVDLTQADLISVETISIADGTVLTIAQADQIQQFLWASPSGDLGEVSLILKGAGNADFSANSIGLGFQLDAHETITGTQYGDTYIISDPTSQVIQSGLDSPFHGPDTVLIGMSSYTLPATFNVGLLGAAPGTENVNLTANDLSQGLLGSSGNDTLTALGGNDTIYLTRGIDVLSGGDGNDLFTASLPQASSPTGGSIDGGAGTDTLDGTSRNPDLSHVALSSVEVLIGGGIFTTSQIDGFETIKGDPNDGNLLTITLADQGSVDLSAMSNVSSLAVTTSTLGDTVVGTAGNDSFYISGPDSLFGGAGNDHFFLSGAAPAGIDGGMGDDTLQMSTSIPVQSVDLSNSHLTSVEILLANATTVTLTTEQFNAFEAIIGTAFTLTDSGTIDLSDGRDTRYIMNNNPLGLGLQITTSADGDTVIGSTLDDTYMVSSPKTEIIESDASLADEVLASTSFALGEGQSIGTFLAADNSGPAPIELVGNSFAQTIGYGVNTPLLVYGGGGRDIISGANGDDTLYTGLPGAPGTDSARLSGAAGNDIIHGGLAGDTINGGNGNDTLDGGGGADTIDAGDGNDVVILSKVDALETVTLGAGTDKLDFNQLAFSAAGYGGVTVTDFAPGNAGDGVNWADFLAQTLTNWTATTNPFGDGHLRLQQQGPDTLLQIDPDGGGNSYTTLVTFSQRSAGSFTAANFGGYGPDGSTPDPIIGTSGNDSLTGTATADTIAGLGGDDTLHGVGALDTLDGGAGNDKLYAGTGPETLIGGAGNDTFWVNADGSPVVIEEAAGGGADSVFTAVSYALGAGQSIELLATTAPTGTTALTLTGNELAQRIDGNYGDNILVSGGGGDTLHGYLGNDTYKVSDAHDQVYENAGEGSDSVFSSVSYGLLAGQSVELLATLAPTGTAALKLSGNELAQKIYGNYGDNTLTGGGGGDTLTGYLGNDIYVVSSPQDHVVEKAGEGTDTVFASASYALQAGQSVEVLATTSAAGTAAINLTGNALVQAINGNAGANTLNDGGGAADTMTGLGGNDTYLVANAADQVHEAAGGGSDTVFSTVSFVLGAGQSVDWLATTLTSGTAAINLTGNALAQTINGNAGSNILTGGAGNDILFGQAGNDTLIGGAGHDILSGGTGSNSFSFAAVSESTGVARDLIQGIALSGGDRFHFGVTPTAIDAEVTHGGLNTVHFDQNLAFDIGAAQLGAHHAVLFDPDAGDLNQQGHLYLIVDVNGVAGYQPGQDYVVELQNATGTLTLGDFT